MSAPFYLSIDHIIILIPYSQLQHPPSWLSKNFTLTPGGRHADNKTENKLIIFRDGSYIELIAFINDDPIHREGHWWGDKDFGVIDFALTTSSLGGGRTSAAEENYDAVMGRLMELDSALGIGYARPRAGGRKRDDGQDVKWEVTFPAGVERGKVPFFCHDVTDRQLRVPMDESNTTHPCGAYGVVEFNVYVPSGGKVEELGRVYGSVLGGGKKVVGDGMDGGGVFEVGRAKDVKGVPLPRICVKTAKSGQSQSWDRAGVVLRDTILGGFRAQSQGTDTQSSSVDEGNALGNMTIRYDVV